MSAIKKVSPVNVLTICMLIITGFSGCDVSPTQPEQDVTGASLFVMNALSQTVSRISLVTEEVDSVFAYTEAVPGDMALLGDRLLVLNSIPASLQVISLQDTTTRQTYNLTPGSNPYDLYATSEHLYVSGLNSGQLYILDAANYRVIDSVGVGAAPEGVAADESLIYVASSDGWQQGYAHSAVHVLSRRSYAPVDTVPVHPNPQRLALATDGMLHVVCTGNYVDEFGVVEVIHPVTLSVETSLQSGGAPGYILLATDDRAFLSAFGMEFDQGSAGFLYTYNPGDFQLLRDSGNPIEVGYGAMGMAYDQEQNLVYVANFKENTVQGLDPQTYQINSTYPVGDGPQSVTVYRPR
ncbi:MAG TPA: hypothetical protein VKA68_02460 [bacterium]|nr:hypothetical protein [bacterium]